MAVAFNFQGIAVLAVFRRICGCCIGLFCQLFSSLAYRVFCVIHL